MRTIESRRGVALIVVLGMLSLLMIMGVAFSVSMRVERSGAGNYAGGVLSRQLVHAALADAIARIDLEVTDDAPYPEWAILTSDPGSTVYRTEVDLAWGDALAHVPAVFHEALSETNCYWIDDSDHEGVIGRRAYTIVNCSGLLNANKVGGKNRHMGFSPDEIQLGELPDFDPSGDVDRFLTSRDAQKPYDSVAEMFRLNTGFGASNHHFIVNSLAGVDTNMVYLSDDKSKWVKADIVRGLRSSGVATAGVAKDDLERAYRNLLDYVDDDSIPQKLDECNGEAVPMINEAIFTYEIERNGDSATVTYGVEVEFFYPFAKKSANTFRTEYEVKIVDTGSDDPGKRLLPVAKNTPTTMDINNPGRGYSVSDELLADGISVANLGTNAVNVKFAVDIRAKVSLGGTSVDEVPVPYKSAAKPLRIPVVIQFAADLGVESKEGEEWVECIDPRFNWDPSNKDFDKWVSSEDLRGNADAMPGYTLGATSGGDNGYVKWLFAHPEEVGWYYDADNFNDGTWAHVANEPLKSVGELGYICLRPWYTIRLYDHGNKPKLIDPDYHTVLDHFSLYPDQGTTSRGLVNVNTYMTNVLGAVFNNMPINEYDANPGRLSWEDAVKIADEIWQAGPYTNLSQLGSATNVLAVTGRTKEIEKEGIIRNSAGLLTTRQNLFTILLAGGPFARGVGVVASRGTMGDWLGTQRAVAVVWRDTFPENPAVLNSPHPVALLYFKWLDD